MGVQPLGRNAKYNRSQGVGEDVEIGFRRTVEDLIVARIVFGLSNHIRVTSAPLPGHDTGTLGVTPVYAEYWPWLKTES